MEIIFLCFTVSGKLVYMWQGVFLYTGIDLKSITDILLKLPVSGTCNLHSSCRLIYQPFASAGRGFFLFNFQRCFLPNLIKMDVITVVKKKKKIGQE